MFFFGGAPQKAVHLHFPKYGKIYHIHSIQAMLMGSVIHRFKESGETEGVAHDGAGTGTSWWSCAGIP